MLREIRACPATTAQPMQTRTIDLQFVELQTRCTYGQQSTVHVSTTRFSQDLAKWAAQDVLHGKCESGAENDTCETKGAIDT